MTSTAPAPADLGGDVQHRRNREHNDALVSGLTEIAETKHATLAQVAIAWVAAQGDDIVPIIGSRRPAQIETSSRLVRRTSHRHRSLDRGHRYGALCQRSITGRR